jgi:hypothetical protein
MRVEDWEEMIDVNIKGVLYGIADGGLLLGPVPASRPQAEATAL